ncbi:MAG TPA: hypothetical protein VF077_08990 [Nitrospiraceae bacterium]
MKNLILQYPDNQKITLGGNVVASGATLVLEADSGTPIPPDPQPSQPPANVPGYLINVNWPVPPAGQVRPTVPPNVANTTNPIRMSSKLPTAPPTGTKPTHTGFARIAEVPGGGAMPRRMQAWVNGVLKFDTGEDGNSAPGLNFTCGNPNGYQAIGAQYNVQPGDWHDIVVYSYTWQAGQNASFLYDLGVPERY